MTGFLTTIAAGAAAGAAGTTALNAVTYGDMVWRARPASSTPETTVEKLAEATGTTIPGDDESRQNRVQGLGPLLGVAAGVGTGAVLGVLAAVGVRPPRPVATLLATAGAMAGSTVPMAALGVSDPRSWSASAWVSDVVPHLAYGAVTATVLDRLTRR